MISSAVVLRGRAQFVETVIGDLKNPARSNDTVGRLEITMAVQVSFVQVNHSFQQIIDQGRDEDVLQFDVVVLQNVLWFTPNKQRKQRLIERLIGVKRWQLTGKLPLWQYSVTMRMRVGSTAAPMNKLMLSWRNSRISRISFMVFRQISRRFEKHRSLIRTIVPR